MVIVKTNLMISQLRKAILIRGLINFVFIYRIVCVDQLKFLRGG